MSSQPRFGREDDGSGRLLDEAGHGDRDPHGAKALVLRRLEGRTRGLTEPVEHGVRRRATVLAIRPTLVADGPRQVLDRDGDVVHVHFESHSDDDVGELERDTRPAHAAV